MARQRGLRRRDVAAALVVVVCLALGVAHLLATRGAENPPQPQQAMPGPPQFAEKADAPGGELVELPLPKRQAFTTPDGKRGWKLKIPGGRPLATPAVVGGVLYVGGGFGSHEFYALDAETGEPVWTCRTGDDGPTAASVAEGCVAYNTESCTILVHDARTGKLLWHRWLGDPLMSQPAVADDRLFMAYPGQDGSHHLIAFRLRTGEVLWDQKIAAEVITAPVVESSSVFLATVDGTLYHFDAKTGKLHWSEKRNVTSAPRIVDGKVYVSQRAVRKIEIATGKEDEKKAADTTVEGLNIVDARTGEFAHDQPQAAVRAAYLLSPTRITLDWMANADLYSLGVDGSRALAGEVDAFIVSDGGYSSELSELKEHVRILASPAAKRGEEPDVAEAKKALALAEALDRAGEATARKGEAAKAKVLENAATEMRDLATRAKEAALTANQLEITGAAAAREQASAQVLDASVGFAGAPDAAKLALAENNLGQANVKAVWAYQGSRPHVLGSRCISVNGERFRAVDTDTGEVAWETKLESKVEATRPATPPALAGGRFYLGTTDGRILCVEPETGKTLWETKVGGRILFEPAVVAGRVYVATDDGTLICLETGDPKADGWAMWGGSARHNGAEGR